MLEMITFPLVLLLSSIFPLLISILLCKNETAGTPKKSSAKPNHKSEETSDGKKGTGEKKKPKDKKEKDAKIADAKVDTDNTGTTTEAAKETIIIKKDSIPRKATHTKDTKKLHKDMDIITEMSDELSAPLSAPNNPHRMAGTRMKIVDGKVMNEKKDKFDKSAMSISEPLLSYVNRYEVETRHTAIEDEQKARETGAYPTNYSTKHQEKAPEVKKLIKKEKGSTKTDKTASENDTLNLIEETIPEQ